MSYKAYSNLEVHEDTLDNTTLTIIFDRPSREIELTNQSTTADLQYKFKTGQDFATLDPTETVTMDVWVRQIILTTTEVITYRLWIRG